MRADDVILKNFQLWCKLLHLNSLSPAIRWMSLDLTDDKSTLVQVMAWCRQTTSHYLNECWPRSMSPYGVTRPWWVKIAIITQGMVVCWSLCDKTERNILLWKWQFSCQKWVELYHLYLLLEGSLVDFSPLFYEHCYMCAMYCRGSNRTCMFDISVGFCYVQYMLQYQSRLSRWKELYYKIRWPWILIMAIFIFRQVIFERNMSMG